MTRRFPSFSRIFRTSRLLSAFLPALLLACDEGGKGTDPAKNCPDQTVLPSPESAPPAHAPKTVTGVPVDSLPGIRFASKDSLAAWFGGKAVKLAFLLDRKLYLAEWTGQVPTLTDLTVGDEGYAGGPGNINSPLFSPDGAWLAYGGSLSSPATSFLREARSGTAPARRSPVDTGRRSAFDPHFVVFAKYTSLWYASEPGPVSWSDRCSQIGGGTWEAEIKDDGTPAPARPTGLPGSFKGGVSKDLRWAGTSYGPSALYDRDAGKTTVLAGFVQQCNPSMNPYPAGSRNTDHMMVLGFGGTPVKTPDGDLTEAIHENLWIYSKADKAVWRGKLPPDAKYRQWQKPEWSTHPRYATAIALHDIQDGVAKKGDLYAVKIPELADKEITSLEQAEGYHLLAEGRFTESSFSHLWIEP